MSIVYPPPPAWTLPPPLAKTPHPPNPPTPPSNLALAPPPPHAWRALARCGDVHPHPGPLTVAVCNTSLRAHWAEVAEWSADALILTETRLALAGQHIMGRMVQQAGWQAFWGEPLPSRGGGVWDAPQGGGGGIGAARYPSVCGGPAPEGGR